MGQNLHANMEGFRRASHIYISNNIYLTGAAVLINVCASLVGPGQLCQHNLKHA